MDYKAVLEEQIDVLRNTQKDNADILKCEFAEQIRKLVTDANEMNRSRFEAEEVRKLKFKNRILSTPLDVERRKAITDKRIREDMRIRVIKTHDLPPETTIEAISFAFDCDLCSSEEILEAITYYNLNTRPQEVPTEQS